MTQANKMVKARYNALKHYLLLITPRQLSVFSHVCVSVCLFTGGPVQGPMPPARHVQTCSLCNSYCRQVDSWHSNEMSFCCNCKDHHRTSIGCEKDTKAMCTISEVIAWSNFKEFNSYFSVDTGTSAQTDEPHSLTQYTITSTVTGSGQTRF